MGSLLGIVYKSVSKGTLKETLVAEVDVTKGIEGEHRGHVKGRQITLIRKESWDDVCDDLGVFLHWSVRRANLLISGLDAELKTGQLLKVGNVLLSITKETVPCSRMDQIHDGLQAALQSDYRGGFCCNVVEGGQIKVGDQVLLNEI